MYKDYNFIAFLGLVQKLGIRFLPITWQVLLGSIGNGGQATIEQARVKLQINFAFKLFERPQEYPFRDIVQKIIIFSYPLIQRHEYIIRLEGVCWDIINDDRVWLVLVFQKTHLGALYKFTQLEKFKNLCVEDRLKLCVNIEITIRDMHFNGE